jgi:rhodanese-related sulfurtransferase
MVMLKKEAFKVFMMVFVVGLIAVIPVSAKSSSLKGYKEINASALKSMMDAGDPLVVFPLSGIEYRDQHITGSVNIPLQDLSSGLPKDKNKTLVFYCLGIKCTASWRAADKAVKLGYKNVYAFREGLPAWVKAGYATTTIEKLPKIEVAKISTDQLFSKMATGKDFVLLDVCLKRDAEKFWIDSPNRLHVPLDQLEARLNEIPKDKEIVIICLKGKRSPTAMRYLKAKGFNNLYSVKGGMQQWILEGKPVKTS